MNKNILPIGVFDSGIGGLTVVREIFHALPCENVIYLGDTARVPYGIRSAETVIRYALEGTRFLLSKNIKLLVIACNTVSAVGIENIRRMTDIPVIGVIEPGARAASKGTTNGTIGVIGTEATIKSGAYTDAIRALRADVRVLSRHCPLFVPLVEEGWIEGELPELAAKTYLEEIKRQGIDTLVLGCTHYPLLKPVLSRVMGDSIRLIDSASETAVSVREELVRSGMSAPDDNRPSGEFYVTDDPVRFKAVGERFLGQTIEKISKIELEVHG